MKLSKEEIIATCITRNSVFPWTASMKLAKAIIISLNEKKVLQLPEKLSTDGSFTPTEAANRIAINEVIDYLKAKEDL